MARRPIFASQRAKIALSFLTCQWHVKKSPEAQPSAALCRWEPLRLRRGWVAYRSTPGTGFALDLMPFALLFCATDCGSQEVAAKQSRYAADVVLALLCRGNVILRNDVPSKWQVSIVTLGGSFGCFCSLFCPLLFLRSDCAFARRAARFYHGLNQIEVIYVINPSHFI